jgi:hypothetical protein
MASNVFERIKKKSEPISQSRSYQTKKVDFKKNDVFKFNRLSFDQ